MMGTQFAFVFSIRRHVGEVRVPFLTMALCSEMTDQERKLDECSRRIASCVVRRRSLLLVS